MGVVVLLVVYGVWRIGRWAPAGGRLLVGDGFLYCMGLAAVWTAWAASRRCAGWRRLQTAWRFVAVGLVAYLGGDIAQTVYERAGSSGRPVVPDALYLTFYPLMLVGILWFPVARRGRDEWVRLALDGAVVAIGGSTLVVYLVVGPAAAAAGSSGFQTALLIAFPVADMVLVLGVASRLGQSIPSSRRALQFLTVGLVCFVASDLLDGYLRLDFSYKGDGAVDSLSMVAVACLAVAGAAQARIGAPEQPAVRRSSAQITWWPYVAVVVGFAVLLFSQRGDPLYPNLVVIALVVMLALLVSARQFLAQRDLLGAHGALHHQALHDSLTGLPNRALVLDRAEQMLARARRVHSPVAALYVDIDNFKQVNDMFGHAAGDALLTAVGARLTSVVRGGDTVGRLSGDEFVALLDSAEFDASPELVAERILDVLRQPVDLNQPGSRPLTVTISIGIASGQRAAADDLLRDADIALYQAKEAGKDRYKLFEASMKTLVHERGTLEMDINDALDNHEFFLLYQPTFDLRNETMTGVEALIRWAHPSRGLLTPDQFIPIAEQNGSIVAIGQWVLEEACAQAVAWHTQGQQLSMAVNVSTRQLDRDEFVDEVRDTLIRTGLDPGALTLEITETTLMRDPAAATKRLDALKTLGLRLAIDDFGTGYSSLAYLQQFPIDTLKIDRSFISGAAASKESTALIHTLVQLGKTLGLQTLGEGIENQTQLHTLQHEQCDLGQGYLFSRPLALEAIEQLFDDPRVRHAETAAP